MAGRGRPPLHREPVGASSASAEGDPPDAHHVRWSSIPATLRASGWTPLYGNARGQGQSERAATVAGLRGGCPSTRRLSASASCQIDRRSQWRIAAPAPKRPNSPRPVEDNGPIFVDEARDPDVLRMDLDAVAAFDRPALLTGGTESAPFFGPVVDMVAGPCRGPSASRSRAPTTRRRSASRHVASSWSRRLRSSGGPVGRAGVGPEASAWMRRFSGNASHLVGSADLWAPRHGPSRHRDCIGCGGHHARLRGAAGGRSAGARPGGGAATSDRHRRRLPDARHLPIRVRPLAPAPSHDRAARPSHPRRPAPRAPSPTGDAAPARALVIPCGR
jgi:hypothetical protein